MSAYRDFLKKKHQKNESVGFEPESLNGNLFPFQKYIVKKALKKGKYAIFADCGLGKTIMQLEWANQVSNHTKRPVLILAPLAVTQQTISEGEKFGIPCSKLVDNTMGNGVYITNYEQLDNIDTSLFSGIVLDESSILKAFQGKTKNKILSEFKNTPFKLACTATPSPNDFTEMGNHAEFLNVMRSQEMLAMYFIQDRGNVQDWRLKRHAEGLFYKWLSTFCTVVNKPSDIGFDDDGYILPKITYSEHEIETEKRNNGELFNTIAVTATTFNDELKKTKDKRLHKAASIANATDEQVIVWVNRNDESAEATQLIPDAVEVKGADKPEDKERKLLGFANGDFRVLVTKKKIAQYGLNYQNCHIQVFASLDFSFEGLYQAIRRSYRFGQKKPVDIHLITTDTMKNVSQSIKDKQKKFITMQTELIKHQ
jgi:hypothetical protein